MKKIKKILSSMTFGIIVTYSFLIMMFVIPYQIHKYQTHITADVIKIESFPPNTLSYCNGKSIIAELPDGKYSYFLPNGDVGGIYNTIEETQKELNNHVKRSCETWIKSK